MKFRTQLVSRLVRADDNSWVYEEVGALVLKGDELQAVPLTAEGEDWADEIRPSFGSWAGRWLDFMTYLYDRNSTTTSYAKPAEISASSFREAAEKARIR